MITILFLYAPCFPTIFITMLYLLKHKSLISNNINIASLIYNYFLWYISKFGIIVVYQYVKFTKIYTVNTIVNKCKGVILT